MICKNLKNTLKISKIMKRRYNLRNMERACMLFVLLLECTSLVEQILSSHAYELAFLEKITKKKKVLIMPNFDKKNN